MSEQEKTILDGVDPLQLLKLSSQIDVPETVTTPPHKAVVVYHANCMDGFTAAWAFHKLVELGKPEAYPGGVTYVPMAYGDGHGVIGIPEYKNCDDLYILDFSFSKYELTFWTPFFRQVILLDHHKTALESLGSEAWPEDEHPVNLTMVLDMRRSGAGITWDWLSEVYDYPPEVSRTRLIDYVEDRDLWKFAMEGSKQVSAYIQMQNRNFARWSNLADEVDEKQHFVIQKGEQLLAQREQMVAEIASNPRKILIHLPNQLPVSGYCVNCSPMFASEVGNTLVRQYGMIGVTYHQDETGATKFSLRSADGLEDVALIAQAFGGGGHRNAAGFVMKDPEEEETIHLTAGRPEDVPPFS
jgi:uncharacterized protein